MAETSLDGFTLSEFSSYIGAIEVAIDNNTNSLDTLNARLGEIVTTLEEINKSIGAIALSLEKRE